MEKRGFAGNRLSNCLMIRILACVAIGCLPSLGVSGSNGSHVHEEGLEERMDIYLLMGQSNMAGRAPLGEEQAGVIPRCFLLNGEDAWEPAENPLNRYSTIRKGLQMQRLGPGYSFARTMLENNPDIRIGLVVNARGGSSIREWAPGTPYYNDALRRVRKAMESGELKGILWHQGESDARDTEYLDKLGALIAALRDDLGAPNLPFVAGQVFYHPKTRAHTKQINDLLATLPVVVPFTGCVLSDGLTAFDNLHFDTESALILGERYAGEMLRLLSGR
jgi:hypothetical protein